MCGKGSNQTTTSTQANPQAMGAYSNLLSQAGQVAATPYQAYGGQLVAPVNQQQNLGIGGINQYAQAAQPAIGQAMGYANAAAQPITAAQIAQYQSPYTQQVVNATQAQFANQNAQQQSALQGNAISQGALGGDRAGVAAANLAGQQQLAQAPVIAGLYNQGYQTAEQTALAEQQQQANAAYSLGNLGISGQNAALTGAGAQIGAGTLQQQTQQAQDLAAYQQFLQQQAYPFQTLSWESGIDTGVGSQMGGTSQTTTPPPNPISQYAGLGLLGAGLFLDRGGRVQRAPGGLVGYDTGGTPYQGGVGWNPNEQPYAGAPGYVPTGQMAMGPGAPKPPNASAPQNFLGNTQSLAQAFKLGQGLNPGKGGGDGGGDIGSSGISMDDAAIDYAEGGTVKDFIFDPDNPGEQRVTPWGGGIRGLKPQGFDLGGDVPDDISPAPYSAPDPNAEWNAFRQDVQSDPTSSVNAQPGLQVASAAPTGGVGGVSPLTRSIWQQESGNQNSVGNSWAGAVGPGQIMPGTWAQYAKPGENIRNPEDNRRVSERIITDYNNRWPNDPARAAVAYYSGPGNVAPPGSPTPWITNKQPINPRTGKPDPSVSQYVQQVVGRLQGGTGQDDMREANARQLSSGLGSPQATAQNQPQGLASDEGPLGRGGLFNAPGSVRQSLMAAGLGMLASTSPFAGVGIGQGGLAGLKAYEDIKNKDTSVDQAHQKLQQQAQFHQDALNTESKKLQQQKDEMDANREERNIEHQKPFPVGAIPSPDGLSPPTPILGIANPAWKPGSNEPKYLGTDGQPIDPKFLNPTLRATPPPVPGAPQQQPPQNTPANPPVPPTAPASPGAPVAGQQPYQVASADGIIPANNKAIESGPYDYTREGPYLEKGMDVPTPQSVAGKSPGAIQTEGELYLQTGKLPPVSRGNSPVAVAQQKYRTAVQNYGTALAESRGLSPEETADMWRSAPGMLRFILGADGRTTVALGTAVRHLDTLEQYAKAWKAGDIPAINRAREVISREFGSAAATNLQSAASIVGPEIIKAIGVAGAGTDAERKNASGQFSAVQSPEQLFGASGVVKGLLGGQLEGRRRQASEAGVSEEKFKHLIGERPYEILTGIDKDKAGQTQAKKPDVTQNGHVYTWDEAAGKYKAK